MNFHFKTFFGHPNNNSLQLNIDNAVEKYIQKVITENLHSEMKILKINVSICFAFGYCCANLVRTIAKELSGAA